jgi:hypothetical protein
MEIWKIIWMVVLVVASAAFIVISAKVTLRGFSEIRELLKNLDERPPVG